MLRINQNTSKALYVTLNEKVTGTYSPYFTWLLTSKDTLNKYYFYEPDFSGSVYYNSFTVSSIWPHGEYTYEIYQMTASNNLDITMAVGMVETGILLISPTYSKDVVAINNATFSINNNLDRI